LDGDEAIGEPLLDDDGVAWLLAEHAAGHRAWRVGHDLEPTTRDVPPTTTSLAVVDGEVVAVTRTGVVAVGGGDDRSAPSGATVPTVAVGTGDAWAHAEGAQVTVLDGGRSSEVTLEDPVEQLVVWSGAVLAVTAGGVHRVEGGDTTPVGEFDDAPRVHTDGGLLWLTSRNRVTAVWDDHTEVTFELAAIDLDLCVGDCEADDVRRFLDQQEEEEEERDEPTERTTTTLDRQQSPTTTRQLRPPSVEPSIPTTTTTTTTRPPSTTTTTTRDRSGGEEREERPTTTRPRPTATTQPTTTTRPTTTTAAPAPPPPPPPRPTWLPPLLPGPRDPGPGDPGPSDPGPGDPGPGPGNGGGPGRPPGPPPTEATTTTAPAAQSTTTTTEPTTTTTEPPPGSVSLVLGVDRDGGDATATVGVQGRAIDCGALVSRQTTGTVSWSGAASGSTQVRLAWGGPGDRSTDIEEVTIANVRNGDLTVSFSACGVQTSQTAGDPDAPPRVSAVTVSPAQPEVGQSFTASVSVEEANGWTVSGAEW
ncbi:MAG TPA: hypothetical protein VLR27_14290, partial [Acidimicrobiales bacterium]|nr:hypothetical protein [Acidimicrobiales bacterium]